MTTSIKRIVEVATTDLGNVCPQIRLVGPHHRQVLDVPHAQRASHYRQVRATLHQLAATLELATPAAMTWIVQIGENRVYLELGHGSERDAALRLLTAVANGASMVTRGDGRQVLVTVPSRD